MRRDKVGARSLNFIEGQVLKDVDQWNLAPQQLPNLLSEPQALHIVHQTNSRPVIEAFFNGRLRDLWLDDDTPGYLLAAAAAGAGIPVNAPLNPTWHWIRAPNRRNGNDYRAVFWHSPAAIPEFNDVHQTLDRCLGRSGAPFRMPPNVNAVIPGCDICNQIMTEESNFRHLLARRVISNTPIVPMFSIIRYNLNRQPGVPGPNPTIASGRIRDPNPGNVDGLYFSFQATIAYYIHRCLPDRPFHPGGAVPPQERFHRELCVMTSFLLLNICALMFERYFGSQGGTQPRRKPAYRFRGIVETLLAYLFWLWLSNDVAYDEPNGGRGCTMRFEQFHRYWFSEITDALILTHPDTANAFEFTDILFESHWNRAGNAGMAIGPNNLMAPPELVIGFMARRVSVFYDNILRPVYSRHFAGLAPLIPPGLAPGPPANNAQIRYNRQNVVQNMLIEKGALNVLMHLCERAVPRDVDSFLNLVGVHSVMKMWNQLLRSAPPKVDNLLDDWIDSWTQHEFQNIMMQLRIGQSLPRISNAAAESIYVMCNALDVPTEPQNDEEMAALLNAPKCSPHKAALRLELAGAFVEED